MPFTITSMNKLKMQTILSALENAASPALAKKFDEAPACIRRNCLTIRG